MTDDPGRSIKADVARQTKEFESAWPDLPRWGTCERCGDTDYLQMSGGKMACLLCRHNATYKRFFDERAAAQDAYDREFGRRLEAISSPRRGLWARLRSAWRALVW